MKRFILGLAVVTAWATASDCYGGISIGGDTTGFYVEDFEDLSPGGLPGLGFSTFTSPKGLVFGERLVGQSIVEILPVHGATGPMEIIGGIPTVPLQMDGLVSVESGVSIYERNSSNVIAGTGPDGQTSTGIGEGGLTVLYPADQWVISFDIATSNPDSFDIQFFARNGGLLGDATVTAPIVNPLMFSSSEVKIAAITIDHAGRNTGGGLFDNFRFASVPEPSTLILAALGLLMFMAMFWRKRG